MGRRRVRRRSGGRAASLPGGVHPARPARPARHDRRDRPGHGTPRGPSHHRRGWDGRRAVRRHRTGGDRERWPSTSLSSVARRRGAVVDLGVVALRAMRLMGVTVTMGVSDLDAHPTSDSDRDRGNKSCRGQWHAAPPGLIKKVTGRPRPAQRAGRPAPGAARDGDQYPTQPAVGPSAMSGSWCASR